MSELNGILPIDKPIGPTSHDMVAIARRSLRERRIGHSGTLDPFASGLLLLCVGPATRLAEYLTALPKSYQATVRFGIATDTDDHSGETISERPGGAEITEDALRNALATQTGVIDQVPPAFSAKKIDGERMYASARKGIAVDAPPSRVEVYSIEITRFEPPEVDLAIECGSGTYIRAIARDVGEELGVGAHLSALRRTRVGGFDVSAALPPERLEDADAVRAALAPPSAAAAHLPRVTIDEQALRAIGHGSAIDAGESLPESSAIAIFSEDGALVAIGERVGAKIQPRKVFA